MSSVPERSEIDDGYKWDLTSIYATDEDWEAAYETVETQIETLRDYETDAFDDGETLLAVLEHRDELMRTVSKVTAYARMRSHEDTRDQAYQAMSARAQSLASEASSAASFIEPAVQTLAREELDAMVEATDGLDVYEHHLDDIIRMKAHTRSAEVEAVLSELGEVLSSPGEIYSMLTDADLTFPTIEGPDGDDVEITQSNFTTLLKRPDREFRKRVHETFYEELGDLRNTIGTSLRNSVKADVKTAQVRRYETARAAAMDGPNIPIEVYDTLVETVHENLDPLHRHAELKRRSLGVDDLRMWDLYMPMTEQQAPDLEYDQAREYVVDALAPLGEEYQSRVAEGLDSRWVDVYENRGKRSGAYSGGTYDTQPFILMNYQNDVASMYTLAHELGHSMHSEYTSDAQPYVYSGYEIFVAEVASTVNETLLTNHLLETIEDDRFRRHVLNEYLERIRSTLYRQTMFADFEHEIHTISEAGDALTPDRLDDLYGDLKAEFYEPAVMDDYIPREWMRVPHFYYGYPNALVPEHPAPDTGFNPMFDYYVYQYSTGISSAVTIADRIREEGEAAVEDYREALRMGGSEYPVEILKHAGVDVTKPEYLETALHTYDDLLDEVESMVR